jgi:cation diffusion facilitator CzcD-associated flavoprotein CzcO
MTDNALDQRADARAVSPGERPLGLFELEAKVRRELQLFEYPSRPWTQPRRVHGEHVHDVCVIGGGQAGIAVAGALRQARITDVVVCDDSPSGLAGPWITYARMRTLRTVKTLPGPSLRVPALTFQSWYEAQHGAAAWEALVRIPKATWAGYLSWLCGVLAIDVRDDTRLTDIRAEHGVLRIELEQHGARHTLLSRKLVLATGIRGAGGRRIPEHLVNRLPPDRWAHTADDIDFRRLRGKTVLVLGAGASAFDNAATALEAGAIRVDLHLRREALPQVNASRWLEFEGLFRHFADLSDEQKWRFMRKIFATPTPPPQDTLERTMRHPNFHLQFGSTLDSAWVEGDRIVLETNQGVRQADFLILGTGFEADLRLRPELKGLREHIALWRDIYNPNVGEESATIGGYPYLGDAFQFTERLPGACPILSDIHLFNPGALPSIGPSSFGINGMAHGVERLARGISRDLFLGDATRHYEDFLAYQDPDPLELPALPTDQAPMLKGSLSSS